MSARCGVGIHVNWGRSCIEHRDAGAPLRDILAACDAGVLRGVLFSGASGEDSPYGTELRHVYDATCAPGI